MVQFAAALILVTVFKLWYYMTAQVSVCYGRGGER
jgi:hypothetical protein